MVRMKNRVVDYRSTYYYKPGQTHENTKPSERTLALIVSKNAYERINDYAQEKHRVALLAERERKRLEALKQASYEMSKSWDDTTQNIQRRRKEELLSRSKLEDQERIEFMKEMKAKNALERAEVVKQAKEILLWRNPQCRLINRALVVSECYRELNEQVKFQKSMDNIDKKLDDAYIRHIKEDVKKFNEEEKKRNEERAKRIAMNKADLEKQIAKNERNLKKLQESTRQSEIQDLENMAKELKEIETKEFEEECEKREHLKKMFLENIEQRKQHELKLKQEEEFQEQSLKMYNDLRREIERKIKQKIKFTRESKILRGEAMAKKIAGKIRKGHFVVKREGRDIEEIIQEYEEKEDQKALEKIAAEKEKKVKARQEMLQAYKDMEEELEKRKKEETDLKLWETLQRFKREEFNKQWDLKHLEEEKNKRQNYGVLLKKQIAQRGAEKMLTTIKEDDSAEIKEMINKANERVLAYGEKVLQESRNVRPLYPIEKAIEDFKKDAGLIPRRVKDTEEPQKIKRKRGKRAVCTSIVKEEDEFYFA